MAGQRFAGNSGVEQSADFERETIEQHRPRRLARARAAGEPVFALFEREHVDATRLGIDDPIFRNSVLRIDVPLVDPVASPAPLGHHLDDQVRRPAKDFPNEMQFRLLKIEHIRLKRPARSEHHVEGGEDDLAEIACRDEVLQLSENYSHYSLMREIGCW